ncbi:unnamed protein product [Blepharisma stoltei]|uniref:Uncharacterized protein n=1 Tax=Blepharisma stoltei TaxID=1481888 RepID=A0AAU9K382_9CILI|nr:unnamed protein product [Blepharisma stoltei]
MGNQCCSGRSRVPTTNIPEGILEKHSLETNRTASTRNTWTLRSREVESVQISTEDNALKVISENEGRSSPTRSGRCPYCNSTQTITSKLKHLECTSCKQICMQDGCTSTLYKVPPGSSLFRFNSPKRNENS